MPTQAPQRFFKLLNSIEKRIAHFRGKGYGAATIEQEVTYLQNLSKTTPKIAIDIGGNIGNYTAELRRRNPSLQIHTFEPSPTNIEKLKHRFQGDPLTKIVPFALTDTVGSATLFSDQPGSGLGSLTQRKLDHLNIDFNTKEVINTMRFEEYWKNELKSCPLDLVKIDVEGHELSTLRGFGDALNVTSAIQFEFGGCNIDTRTYFQDFWYFFKNHKFDVYRITPIGLEKIAKYRESDEAFLTTNYIAVRE